MSTDNTTYDFRLENDAQQLELVKYIFELTDCDPTWGFYAYQFWYRFCTDKIRQPFRKEQYLANSDIISTIEGFGLDVEKFWFVLLFIYDWSEQQFIKCVDVKAHSHGQLLDELLLTIGTGEDITITIRKDKRNIKIPTIICRDIIKALQDKKAELEAKNQENLYAYHFDDFTTDYPVASYKMCFAAEKYKLLFLALERMTKIHAPVKSKDRTLSYNKMLLISRILYLYKFTDNDKFLYSEESLKGILKTYKGRIPHTISSAYM